MRNNGRNASESNGKIGFRFPQKIIDELLDIRWCDWPQSIIEQETRLLLDEDVNEEVIARMRAVAKDIAG